MRKKSHISLANYLIHNIQMNQLTYHRKAFYIGSILPDCKPSFLTTRHEITGTFSIVEGEIYKLTNDFSLNYVSDTNYFRTLGVIIHYIADYFTYPHNNSYTGSIKDHCIYEKHLKNYLREYIQSDEVEKENTTYVRFYRPEDICDYILKAHEEYIIMKHTVEKDCHYIVNLCRNVVRGILYFLREQRRIPVYA